MVAIVIPIYKEFSDLDFAEKISLMQTFKVLHAHDICFVTHKDINIEAYSHTKPPGVKIKTFIFDKSYFANIDGYNKLLLGYEFYKSFTAYTHILICQLDVFVFSDRVEHFIKMDYDYIGAPWFEGYGLALKTSKLIGSGNGGFSLRRVKTFLNVLDLFNLFRFPFFNVYGIQEALTHVNIFLKITKHSFLVKKRSYLPILPWQFPYYEDRYWSEYVKQFFPWFKVATIKDATAFSFEANPEVLFSLNNQELPMACHAWQKHNPEFWKPHIEKFGYRL